MSEINTDAFLNELNAVADKVQVDYEQFVRKVCWDLFERIRKKWAFDTGLSKNNWHIQAGQPDKTVYPNQEQQQSMNDFVYNIFALHISGELKNSAIYITNNVHYAEFLELSPTIAWGKKPNPYQGTVRIALTEFEDMLRQYNAGGTP